MCGKEFWGRSSELAKFLGGENAKAFGPCAGPWNDDVVVRVDSWREGTDPLEVREREVHACTGGWLRK